MLSKYHSPLASWPSRIVAEPNPALTMLAAQARMWSSNAPPAACARQSEPMFHGTSDCVTMMRRLGFAESQLAHWLSGALVLMNHGCSQVFQPVELSLN